MSRVKPVSITGPAMELGKRLKGLALPVLGGLVGLALMVAVYNWVTVPGTGRHWPSASPPVAATTPLCPGEVHLVTFDGTWRRLDAINPALYCRFVASIPPGSVEMADGQGPFLAVGWINRNPDRVRTVSGKAETFSYSLCPPDRQNRPVNFDCSFK